MLCGTKVLLRKSTALEAKVLFRGANIHLVEMDIGGALGGQSRLDLA